MAFEVHRFCLVSWLLVAVTDQLQFLYVQIGVSFTRFQTAFFRQHFSSQLGKMMVSYGPCQTPTLWFCVHRHDQISTFQPTPFWTVEVELSPGLHCSSTAGTFWNQQAAESAVKCTQGWSHAKVRQLTPSMHVLPRPLPLNTVQLLKMASDNLGIWLRVGQPRLILARSGPNCSLRCGFLMQNGVYVRFTLCTTLRTIVVLRILMPWFSAVCQMDILSRYKREGDIKGVYS